MKWEKHIRLSHVETTTGSNQHFQNMDWKENALLAVSFFTPILTILLWKFYYLKRILIETKICKENKIA